MRWIVFFAAPALAGGVLSALVCAVPGRRRTWLFALFAVPVTAGGWLLALYLYARWQRLPLTRAALFPDRVSLLVWAWVWLLLALLLGALLGCLRAGGLRAFFRGCVGSRPHRLALGGFLTGSLVLAVVCAALFVSAPPPALRLSEACCCNFNLRMDPNTGEYEDYIELENTGEEPLQLGGCFLSDRIRKRNLFRLPALSLGPGERLILWADGTGSSGKANGAEVSLNFTLDPGETVYLYSQHGLLLDSVKLDEREKNISMTRQGDAWVRAVGTPGQSGEDAPEYRPPTLPAPTLSEPSGFYAEPLRLTAAAAPGSTLHYTLDGSVPDANDPVFPDALTLTDRSPEPNLVRSQPNTTIDRSGAVTEPVDKGTVLRLIAVNDAGEYSETLTAVYFVGETFTKYAGQNVLSLVADPEDLFGENGICVTGPEYDRWLEGGAEGKAPTPNYSRKGRESERDAQAQFWDEAHTLRMDVSCGVRLQGNASRAYANKRFSVYARDVYSGSDVFPAELFAGYASRSVSTRSDVYDFMLQQLVRDRDVGTLDALPVQVFLNGEFYETSYLRERYDRQWFAAHCGAEEDELTVITDDRLDYGTAQDFADYQALMEYIRAHDCADPAVWAEIERQIDVQSLLDFLAINFYCNNIDWRFEKNYRLWKVRSGGGEGVLDGRWRWLIYDTDAVGWASEWTGTELVAVDPFQRTLPWIDGTDNELTYMTMPVISDLMKNPEFRTRFLQTYLDLMNVNFNIDHAAPTIARFGLTEHWLWTDFLTRRPPYALDNLTRALKPESAPCALSVTVSDAAGGGLRLNTVTPDLSDGVWQGTWLTDVPLTLTAEPREGWRFVGWRGAADTAAQTLTLTPTGDTALTAVFEKLPSAGP